MVGFINVIAFLLIAVGWCLIAQAARDVFVTARIAATVRPKNGGQAIYYSLSYLVMGEAYRTIR